MQYQFDGERERRAEFAMPKRTKQMGGIEQRLRIFVEDYVYTYLYQYGKSGGGTESRGGRGGKESGGRGGCRSGKKSNGKHAPPCRNRGDSERKSDEINFGTRFSLTKRQKSAIIFLSII